MICYALTRGGVVQGPEDPTFECHFHHELIVWPKESYLLIFSGTDFFLPVKEALWIISRVTSSYKQFNDSKWKVPFADFFKDVTFDIVHKVAAPLLYRSPGSMTQRMRKNSKKLAHIFQSIKFSTI